MGIYTTHRLSRSIAIANNADVKGKVADTLTKLSHQPVLPGPTYGPSKRLSLFPALRADISDKILDNYAYCANHLELDGYATNCTPPQITKIADGIFLAKQLVKEVQIVRQDLTFDEALANEVPDAHMALVFMLSRLGYMYMDVSASFTLQDRYFGDLDLSNSRRELVEASFHLQVCQKQSIAPMVTWHSWKLIATIWKYSSAQATLAIHALHDIRPWSRKVQHGLERTAMHALLPCCMKQFISWTGKCTCITWTFRSTVSSEELLHACILLNQHSRRPFAEHHIQHVDRASLV